MKSYTHSEMLDLVVVDGHAKGIIVRNLQTGEITRHNADAWCWRPAVTATSIIFPPTPVAQTARPSGALTNAVRASAIRATRRFIRPASR